MLLLYVPCIKHTKCFSQNGKTGAEWWGAIRSLGFALSPADFQASYDTFDNTKVVKSTGHGSPNAAQLALGMGAVEPALER